MAHDREGLISALRQLARLMEINGENAFRCRAIENGANALEALSGSPAEWIKEDKLKGVKGVGESLRSIVAEWAEQGLISDLETLKEKTPKGLLEMLDIPGMGPKKVVYLWKEAKIDSLDALEAAAKSGDLAEHPGFGKKTCENILAGIEQRRRYSGRHHLDIVTLTADNLLNRIRCNAPVKRAEIAGSLRRGRETVKDIDIIVSTEEPKKVMEVFLASPGIERVVAGGETKSSILLDNGIPVDLRVVEDNQFSAALQYFTGSKEHNSQLRGRAREMGMRLNEYGLYKWDGDDGEFDPKKEKPLQCKTEGEIYRKLGLVYIDPSMREGRGEIEAAEKDELPKELIDMRHMQGVLHCHTQYSDGKNTAREMAEASKEEGYAWLGITDHSQTAAYAGGLKPEDLRRQSDEIDRLNDSIRAFRIFKGVESDILPDGSLDYTDDELDELDFVVISVHSSFNQSREEMTERICKAISHPAATILGHATGRLLLKREGYNVDLSEVFKTAAFNDVAIEINANPWRLDLDWRMIREAREAGCRFAINPDAHNVDGIDHIRYGLAVARKGWLQPDDVINTWCATEFEKWLKARRKKAATK